MNVSVALVKVQEGCHKNKIVFIHQSYHSIYFNNSLLSLPLQNQINFTFFYNSIFYNCDFFSNN